MEYSFDDFYSHLRGFERKEAQEWDRTRHIMFAVVKAGGSKKIRKVTDILEIPILDHKDVKPQVRQSLLKRLEEFKKRNVKPT